MNVLRIGLVVAGVATMLLSTPASAQFYFKSKDLSGPRVTGAEPGILGQDLPGATPTEHRAALLWNLRAALNVAALQCQFEPTLLTLSNYNAMLRNHTDELRDDFEDLMKYFRRVNKTTKAGQTAFDQFGTRVYSGFSTVAAQRIFCQIASNVGRDALYVKRGELGDFAATRMQELRNALRPWGEQQFRSGGYAYLAASAPQLPANFNDKKCWRKDIWQEKRCGQVYYRMAATPPTTAVANR
ncbi:hypothetical protein [Sphingomonas sp. 37zxx]|uniref:hypothetical protein n=1 Tax=Sphingomonas sp. 37zxx TaxID=1550073 RepID=UPI00068F983B|nr:hypothetical protein [Sphingomonas sp. 37zxx]